MSRAAGSPLPAISAIDTPSTSPKTGSGVALVMTEINALGDTLQRQRTEAVESTALLTSVMGAIDVAVFAFDRDEHLVLVNPAGERLMGQPAARLLGRGAADLKIAACLEGETPRLLDRPFGPESGRLELRRSTFRRDGKPHQLLVFADLSRALREEEQQAARLPKPQTRDVQMKPLVHRVAELENRLPVKVNGTEDFEITADPDQLEQLLINIVRNAVDATLDAGGGTVAIDWKPVDGALQVTIDDEGPGLPDTSNLFVPFFTTKPAGSGIGLALSRQIAEAHGGTLALENRAGARGCRATLRLPV